MPTTQDLDRLRALLAQLQTVSSFQPGELIRAADWNMLAGVVADVAWTLLASESASAVPPHEHLDQVGLNWFTQAVNDLIQRGPLADPATQNRLTELEQNLQRLRNDLNAAIASLADFRARLSDVATNDLARQTAITTVQRALNNVADPRPDIAAMRASLDAVQSNLATVQNAAARLTVNGAPVDVGALAGRITNLEQFRDGMKSASGGLLDATTIEHRFAQLQATAVTQDQLQQAFKDHPPVIPADQISGLETRLGTVLRDQVNTQLKTFQGQVQSTVETRLAGVSDLVSSRINDAMPGLTQTLTTNLNANIASAQKAAIAAANVSAQAAIAAREQAIRADLATQIASVNAGVGAAVGAQVTQQVGTALQSIRGALDAATQKLDAVTATVTQQGADLHQHATALAQVPQTLASMKNDLQQTVLNEINLQVKAINRGIDDRFAAFNKTQADQINAATQNILSKATDAATQAATTAANNAASAMRAQIVADMQNVARDQATAILNTRLKSAVTSAVNEQFAAVPGMVAGEVQRVTKAQVTPLTAPNIIVR